MGYTADTEIKASSARNPELSKILSLKHGVGQNIALYVSPDAGNSVLLTSDFLVHSTSFFPSLLPT